MRTVSATGQLLMRSAAHRRYLTSNEDRRWQVKHCEIGCDKDYGYAKDGRACVSTSRRVTDMPRPLAWPT